MGTQTFAMADANVCIRGCIYLHPGKQIFKGPKRDALQTTLSWLPRGKKPAEKPKNCTLMPFCAIFRNASQMIFCTKEMKCAWRFSILSKNATSFKLSFCKLSDFFPNNMAPPPSYSPRITAFHIRRGPSGENPGLVICFRLLDDAIGPAWQQSHILMVSISLISVR